MKVVLENQDGKLYQRAQTRFWADVPTREVAVFPSERPFMYLSQLARLQAAQQRHLSLILCTPLPPAEMSVRMSNLDNERDERDEDSHEDRGISEFAAL